MMDDPSLTARRRANKDPIRVILDADDYLASDRRVFNQDSPAPTWVALPEGRAFDSADDHYVPNGRVVLTVALMRELAARESCRY